MGRECDAMRNWTCAPALQSNIALRRVRCHFMLSDISGSSIRKMVCFLAVIKATDNKRTRWRSPDDRIPGWSRLPVGEMKEVPSSIL